MKRPEQHVIDSESDAIFRTVFSKWAVNPSERDYGWDYIVEVFLNGESTGLRFDGQLKGSRHTAYSANRTFISQELELDSADYLARQLRQPTFLFHADVASRKLFWSAIQLDQDVLKILEQGTAKSLTVRIPTANLLPENWNRFLRDLNQAQTLVVSRVLLQTEPIDFVDAMRSQPIERLSEMAGDLHEKGFRLQLDGAWRQRNHDLAGAIEATKKVIAGATATSYTDIHFNAVLQVGELEYLQISRSNVPQVKMADKKLAIALELCRIARRKPRHLHLFAQITLKAAELAVIVQKTLGLVMNWKMQLTKADDPVWFAVVSFQLQQNLLLAHRKYNQSLRLAQATAGSRFRWITSRPIGRIALEIGTLAGLLESSGFKEAGFQYRQSAFYLFRFSAAVAAENESMDELFDAVMCARTLEREPDGAIFKWVKSVIGRWPEENDYRKRAEELMERAVLRLRGQKFEGDIETTPRQIHNNLLTSQGIDPTAEPWASLIDLAIKDEDPTRVMIDCQHKVVIKHPDADPRLDRLGLGRANPKVIGCELHKYTLSGLELDNINQRFTMKFCDSCPDKFARAAGWTFYDESF